MDIEITESSLLQDIDTTSRKLQVLRAAGIRVAIVEFDVADPEKHMLYSDAASCQLVPALRAMLARLESGALRMPVDGRFRWEDVDVDP